MADWSWRRSGAVGACLVLTVGVLTGYLATTTSAAPGHSIRVLQMNLCDSGIAACYTGRSVAEAAAVIRSDTPDVVTLNEVCQQDVDVLEQTMAGAHLGGTVMLAFRAATDRRTAGAFRCLNGQPYGIGLLVHVPAADSGHTTYSGIYPTQDVRDPEERAWVCIDAPGNFDACTTHLASTSPTVALSQCHYLLRSVIPSVRVHGGGAQPTVLGGDLNLRYGGSTDVRSCLRWTDRLAGDDGVQYIVATGNFTVGSHAAISMRGTTDHPGLLVALTTHAVRI